MPDEPIVPVIRLPKCQRPSEDELDRERRIGQEVREGRDLFDLSFQDRALYKKAEPSRSKPEDATAPSRPETKPVRKSSDEGRKVSPPAPRDDALRTSMDDLRQDEHGRRSRDKGRVSSSKHIPDMVNSSSKPVPSAQTQHTKVLCRRRHYSILRAIL